MPTFAHALVPQSGAQTARLFGATLAVVWVVAWWSWALEAPLLIGADGLLPLGRTLAQQGPVQSPLTAPSLFWLDASELTQQLVTGVGLIAAAVAASGFALRPLLATTLVAYVSFVSVGAPFLPLLGDRLLIVATLLALLLPRNRPSPFGYFVARLIVIRLYVTSGIAHLALAPDGLQSVSLAPLLARSALPSWGGYWLATLPAGALALLGQALVLIELTVPWLLLGPRRVRLVAGMVLTAMQLVGVLLANAGLYPFVLVALQLFALGDGDVELMVRDLSHTSSLMGRTLRHLTEPRRTHYTERVDFLMWPWRAVRASVLCAVLVVGTTGVVPHPSLALGLWTPRPLAFGPQILPERAQTRAVAGREVVLLEVLPSAQERQGARTEAKQSAWQPVRLWHTPAETTVAPRLVAPHAPRLDLALGALGALSLSDPPPPLIRALAQRLCTHPEQLGRLVRPHSWRHAQAVRLRLYDYAFAPFSEHRKSGAYWERRWVADGATWRCDALAIDPS